MPEILSFFFFSIAFDLQSIVYVGFQERRLQYTEKEQLREWQIQRCGERILEVGTIFRLNVYF